MFPRLTQLRNDEVAGAIWLCHDCLESSKPVKPRKSKSQYQVVTPNVVIGLEDDTLVLPTNELPKNEDHSTDKVLREGFKVGKCPHGIRGKKLIEGKRCGYHHPKLCKKFCRQGSKGKQGCKRGSSCKFYHPVLCKYSVKKRLCTNEQCTYTHLKGTARKLPVKKQHPERRPANKSHREQKKSSKVSNDDQNNANSFLELKTLVEKMSHQFQQEIASMKMLISYPQLFPSLPISNPSWNQTVFQNKQKPSLPTAPPGFIPQLSC